MLSKRHIVEEATLYSFSFEYVPETNEIKLSLSRPCEAQQTETYDN